MHSIGVVVHSLRVNGLKREWWLDLPELTSIRLGKDAFRVTDDKSSELIMRSGDDEMHWRIDLPKLTTLTTTGNSATFRDPRSITLEGIPYPSILTNRHALSHHCYSCQVGCFQLQENRSCKESLFLLSLIPRHHSRSSTVSLVPCFFHTPFSSQHQIAVFTSHNNYSFPYSLPFFLWDSMPYYPVLLHTKSLIS